jgi:ribosomal protein L35AE/L33A
MLFLQSENTITNNKSVVLNDKVDTANETTNYVSKLVSIRIEWENNAYRKSNEQLYALLASCYRMYTAMCLDNDTAKQLRKDLNDYIESNKLTFKKSSHTLVRIVRCVFGEADKRRISTYGIVLRSAFSQQIESTKLVDFIKQYGGVQEIKLAKSNALSVKAKAQVAVTSLDTEVIAEIENKAVAAKLDASKIGQRVVFIGKQMANGKFVINGAVNSEGAVNTAMAAYYSANKETLNKVVAERKLATNDASLTQAINKAAA